MSDPTRYEKGREVFKEVMGFDVPPGRENDPLVRATVESLFGEVWSRGGLSRRDRRLITIVVLTCLGQAEYLKMHLARALDAGELTAAEVEEIMLHVAYYAGWPLGTAGSMAAREVIEARTPKDRKP
jgi:4-carboxymuconolactone decarboxylase